MVLLDTETPGTSREIYSEDAEGETRTRNPWITNQWLEHWVASSSLTFHNQVYVFGFSAPAEILYTQFLSETLY